MGREGSQVFILLLLYMPEQLPQPTSEHPHPKVLLDLPLLLPLGHEWLTYMWANLHVF